MMQKKEKIGLSAKILTRINEERKQNKTTDRQTEIYLANKEYSNFIFVLNPFLMSNKLIINFNKRNRSINEIMLYIYTFYELSNKLYF